MNRLIKIISILLIQSLMPGNVVLAGESIDQTPQMPPSCLSPHIFVDSKTCIDILSKSMIKPVAKRKKQINRKGKDNREVMPEKKSSKIFSIFKKEKTPDKRMLTKKNIKPFKGKIKELTRYLKKTEILLTLGKDNKHYKNYKKAEKSLSLLKEDLNSIQLFEEGGFQKAEKIMKAVPKIEKKVKRLWKAAYDLRRKETIEQNKEKANRNKEGKQIIIIINLGTFNFKNLMNKIITTTSSRFKNLINRIRPRFFKGADFEDGNEELTQAFEKEVKESSELPKQEAYLDTEDEINKVTDKQKRFSQRQRDNLWKKLDESRRFLKASSEFLGEGFILKNEKVLRRVEQAINDEDRSSSSLHSTMNRLKKQIELIVLQKKVAQSEQEKPKAVKPKKVQYAPVAEKKTKNDTQIPVFKQKRIFEEQEILDIVNSSKNVISKFAAVCREAMASPLDIDVITQLILKKNKNSKFDLAMHIRREARKTNGQNEEYKTNGQIPDFKALNDIDKFLESAAQKNKAESKVLLEYRRTIITALRRHLKSRGDNSKIIKGKRLVEFLTKNDSEYDQCKDTQETIKVFHEELTLLIAAFGGFKEDIKTAMNDEMPVCFKGKINHAKKMTQLEFEELKNAYATFFLIFPRRFLLERLLDKMNKDPKPDNIDIWLETLEWNMLAVIKNIFYERRIPQEQREEWQDDFLTVLFSLPKDYELAAAAAILRIATTRQDSISEDLLIENFGNLDVLRKILDSYKNRFFRQPFFMENYKRIKMKIEKRKRLQLLDMKVETKSPLHSWLDKLIERAI